MKRHLLLFLTLAALLLPGTSTAQVRKTFDLRSEYGLNEMQSMLQLSNLGTLDAMKAKFPRAYARQTAPIPGPAWSDARFMTLSAFDAAWLDAVWNGLGGGQPISGWLSSNNDIIIPAGTYYQTITAEYSGGTYRGAGPGFSDTNSNSQNTRLVIWHERWNGDPNERHGMQAGPWGGKGNITYVEATRIESISLDGRSKEFPNQRFNSSGIRMWKPGEVTTTHHVFARNFRTAGIEIHGATPHHIGTISVFENVVAGVLAVGNWGGTINIDLVSGDDNGVLLASYAGHGQQAGGTWNVGVIKLETQVATEPNGTGGFERVHRGMPVGEFHGQFAVNIGAISAASGSGVYPAMFVVDPRLTTGELQGSHLHVGTLKGYNYQYLVHDLSRGRAWAKIGDYRAHRLEYDAAEGLAWQTGSRPLTAINSLATFRVAHQPGSAAPIPMGATATRHKNIILGPPKSSTIVYLGEETGTTPPCTYTYSAWITCTNGRQTRTAIASPAGCTGSAPADSLSRACTVAPTPCTYTYSSWSTCTNGKQTRTVVSALPAGCTGTPGPLEQPCTTVPSSTTTGFNPADVLVVSNTADPRTAAWAQAYATAWGIPAGNIIAVNAGTNPVATNTVAATIRTAVEAQRKEVTLLAWEYPSRLSNGQSITSAVDFGVRNPSDLTVSAHYNYTGTKPRTDRGFAKSYLLVSDQYIRRDAHASNPTGQSILVLAKDVSSQGNPRGSARAGQTATGVVVWDNRSLSNVGSGSNACNYISNECWRTDRKPGTTPIIAAYQSMFNLGSDGGAVWAKGYFGDHVTSFGGFLPALNTGLNSNGQTPLTYHLDRGASLSVGSVSEPWQTRTGFSPGSLVEQFVDVRIFHPAFVGGMPVGVAAYAAVRCPDRMLFAGDPLCAPFAK